jgi:hypothetical protein
MLRVPLLVPVLALGLAACAAGGEAPPDPPAPNAQAAAPLEGRDVAGLPQPGPGESIEITSTSAPALTVRWP